MLSRKDSTIFCPALLTTLMRFGKSTTYVTLVKKINVFLFDQIESSPAGQKAIVGEVKQEILVPVDGGEDKLLIAK